MEPELVKNPRKKLNRPEIRLLAHIELLRKKKEEHKKLVESTGTYTPFVGPKVPKNLPKQGNGPLHNDKPQQTDRKEKVSLFADACAFVPEFVNFFSHAFSDFHDTRSIRAMCLDAPIVSSAVHCITITEYEAVFSEGFKLPNCLFIIKKLLYSTPSKMSLMNHQELKKLDRECKDLRLLCGIKNSAPAIKKTVKLSSFLQAILFRLLKKWSRDHLFRDEISKLLYGDVNDVVESDVICETKVTPPPPEVTVDVKPDIEEFDVDDWESSPLVDPE